MRKVISNILIVFMAVVFCSNRANAAIDIVQLAQKIVETAQEYIGTVENKVSAVTTEVNKVYSGVKDKYEMAKKKVGDKFASLTNGKDGGNKPISTMKDTKSAEILNEQDQQDPEKISKVMQQLFMAYPSNDPIIMAAYRRKAEEFWADTLVEMYVVSRTFDEQIKELEETIDKLSDSKELAGGDDSGGGGEGGEGDAEQEVPARMTEYNALDAFNDLAKLSETLATLRAQYRAARYIRFYVIPKAYKGSKSSALISEEKIYVSAKESFDLSFAALEFRQKSATLMQEDKAKIGLEDKIDAKTKQNVAIRNSETAKTGANKSTNLQSVNNGIAKNAAVSGKAASGAGLKTLGAAKTATEGQKVNNGAKGATSSAAKKPFGGYVFDVDANTTLKFKKAADPELKSAFSGSEGQFEILERMQKAYDILTKAINVHNIKQALPSYKNTFDSYHDIVYKHIMAITNVQISDQCAINFLSNYYRNPEKVWYGSSSFSNPTDYEARKGISGWAYKSFQAGKALVVDGETIDNDAVGSTEYEMKDDEDENAGFSNSDIGAVMDDTGDIADKYKDTVDDDSGSEEEDEDNESGVIVGLASQTDAAKIQQNVRFREKFNFLIGSEIAKALAADQYGAQKWGKPYRKFKIWNDQKSFYDVYIEKKYRNMYDYLNEVSYLDFLIDMVKVTKSNYTNDDEDTQKEVRSELQTTYNYYQSHKSEITKKLDAANKYKQLIDERKNVLAAMQKNYEMQKSSTEEAIQRIRTALDGIFEQINVLQEKMDAQEKIISEAKANLKQAKNEEIEGKARLAVSERKKSGFLQNVMANKVKHLSEKATAEKELNAAKAKMKLLRKQQETSEKSIQDKKKAMVEMAAKFETDYIGKEKIYENQINAARGSKITNGSDYTVGKIYKDFLKHKNKIVLNNILPKIDGNVLECVKAYTMEQVKKAEEEVKTKVVGDVKYTATGAGQILEIHKKMMRKFKPEAIDLKNFEIVKKDGNGNITSIYKPCGGIEMFYLKGAAEVIKTALYKKICPEGSCLEQDTEYFIGVAPTERDFMAAHAMAEGALPPVREIVYFDNGEYTGLEKKNKLIDFTIYKTINRKDASLRLTNAKQVGKNMVGVPEIWQKMLDPHAYVEVGYDLSILNAKGEEAAKAADNYVRGGIYPCKAAKDLYVDMESVSDGKSTYFGVSSYKPSGAYDINVPECQEIGAILVKNPKKWFEPSAGRVVANYDIKLESSGKAYIFYDKIYNKCSWSRHDGIIELKEKDMKNRTASSSSELAMLISYIEPPASSVSGPFAKMFPPQVKDGTVVVAKTPVNIFKQMKKKDDGDECRTCGKISFYEANGYRTQLKRNQIGDFLTMVETEQTLSESESELSEKIKSLRESLKASLKTAGIEINPEIDLSDVGQYHSLDQKLETAKARLLAQLSNEMIKLTGDIKKDNELLDEKMVKLNAVRKALLKDEEAMVVISENSDGSKPEFAQEIKSAKANKKASKKYEDEVSDHKTEKVAPYCASYPIF